MATLLQRMFGGQIVRSTATYAIADVVNKGIPFILLPVIARYLSPADYGLLTNFSVLTQILLALCALNTYSALSVSYFTLGKNGLPGYLSNLLYLIAILATSGLILSSLLSATIQQYLGISRVWQLLALLTAFSTAVYTLYTALLRMQMKVILFSAVQVAQSLASSLLAIAFVVQLNWNWQGRALSITAAAAASMLFCIWSLRKDEQLFSRIRGAQIWNALSFGLPLLPHTLSFWIKTGMVKIFITNSIALTLGSLVGVFTDSFFSAYTPSMFKQLSLIDSLPEHERATIRRTLVKNTYRFAVALFAVCVGSWVIMRVTIPVLFRGGYLDAIGFLPLVFLALYFDGLYGIVSGYVFYRRKTKVLGTITFLSSLLQVTLTLLFVKPFGLVGALYAHCLVSVLTFLAVFIHANRLYHLPWGLRSIA
jgi:O-antigen/teichoic acid export membrane protein